MKRALLAVLLALPAGAGCAGCPPSWLDAPPESGDWIYAGGACGEVFVDADARDVALTRAARALAERLGLDVSARLSVRHVDGRLWVEAVGAQGGHDGLDRLQLVDSATCDGVTHVLVRLPRG